MRIGKKMMRVLLSIFLIISTFPVLANVSAATPLVQRPPIVVGTDITNVDYVNNPSSISVTGNTYTLDSGILGTFSTTAGKNSVSITPDGVKLTANPNGSVARPDSNNYSTAPGSGNGITSRLGMYMRVKFDNTTSVKNLFTEQFVNGTSKLSTLPVLVKFDLDGKIKDANGNEIGNFGSGDPKNVSPYQANTWYDVIVDLDIPYHRYSAWINGALVVDNLELNNSSSTITGLLFNRTAQQVAGSLWIAEAKAGKSVTDPNADAPFISTQPPAVTTVPLGGSSPVLSGAATVRDDGQLTYQWYRNGTPIAGETNPTFNAPTTALGTTNYYVVVTNTNNSATGAKRVSTTSSTAVVTVKITDAAPPSIGTQPVGAELIQNASSPALSVAASVYDGGALSYQWYSNATNSNSGGTPISGAIGASYNAPTGTAGTTYYYVVVTNTNNSLMGTKTATTASSTAAVIVHLPQADAVQPRIGSQPTGATVTQGAHSPTLSVTASVYDGGTLSYQWYGNATSSNSGGTAISDATSASITAPTGMVGTTYYYVVVKNTNISATGSQIATVASNAVAVTVQAPDEFDGLRAKWTKWLAGGDYDPSDPDITANIVNSTNTANNYWNSLIKNPNRTSLWSDLSNWTASGNITDNYKRIKSMALAYATKGSALQGNASLANDIVSALDWMYANKYNERVPTEFDNWYDWEIGSPQALTDAAILMYDELTATQISNYNKAIDRFVPNPTIKTSNGITEAGANRSDKAQVVIIRGILGKSGAKIAQGRDALSQIFLYVTSGDGFYEDGSFIQHSNVAYTLSYGDVLLADMAKLTYILSKSSWDITDSNVRNVYKWVTDSYQPLIYKGAAMDMVGGRKISRANSQEHSSGRGVITSIAYLAQSAPPDQAASFKGMVKAWIQQDTTFSSYYSGLPTNAILTLKAIMNDNTIIPGVELVKNKVFASMDRVVHLRSGFGFGISMFSNRISAFESGGGDNLKGWWTGNGMTYLYDNDLNQYDDNFWPTVNMYRLPGTTADGTGSGTPKTYFFYPNTYNWVGGSTVDGLYGSVGMQFSLSQVTGSPLQGKKSWFMFGDKIVALGAGITDTNNAGVETIVDNHKLNSTGNNTLTVNGVVQPNGLGWSDTMSGVQWAHLAGNVPGSDVGYYFPVTATVYGLREPRTGAWSEISENGGTTPYTNNYLSLAFEHGANPTNANYAYAVLPNKSAADMAAYAGNPDISILENSTDAQAVKDTTLNAVGASFWNDASKTVSVDGKSFITSDKKASLTTIETANQIDIGVSDPTQSNTGTINIEINRSASGSISIDPGITVTQLSPTIKMTVNVNGSLGKTFNARFNLVNALTNAVTPSIHTQPAGATVNQNASSPTLSVAADVSDGGTLSYQWYRNTTSSNSGGTAISGAISASYAAPTGAVGTTYYYVVVTNTNSSATGSQTATAMSNAVAVKVTIDNVTTPSSNNADLSGLTLSNVTLTPAFTFGTTSYSASVPNSVSSTTVTASVYDTNATMTVNGAALASGQASGAVILNVGSNPITIIVTAQNGTTKTYTISVMRASSSTSGSGSSGGDVKGSTSGTGITTPPASDDTQASITAVVNPFQTKVINRDALVKVIRDSIDAAKNMKVSFSDVSNHWDNKDITLAVQLRIVDGYKDGTFHPDALVTRAEFAAMVVRAFGLENGKTSVSFKDTSSNWAFTYINTLAANGIANGYTDGSFKPDAMISRAEMVTIFARVLDLSQLAKGSTASFNDVSSDYWASDAIQQASSANLIQGETTSTFEPDSGATRAEVLTVIIRALESDSSIKELIQGM